MEKVKKLFENHGRDSVLIKCKDGTLVVCTQEQSKVEPFKSLIKRYGSQEIGEFLDKNSD